MLSETILITSVLLYVVAGHMDVDTREWTDGVLTGAARAVAKQPLDQRSWIVCDGDVDPEWIESLNSVLDDNRQLSFLALGLYCCAIILMNHCHLCNDLTVASASSNGQFLTW